MTLPKDPSKIGSYLKRLSEAQLGEKNHNYGKPKSEDTRKKMSAAQKGIKSKRFGNPGPNLGKSPSVEARRKMSLAKKGVPRSLKTRTKIGDSIKKIMSDPHIRRRISQKMQGKNAPNWRGGISFLPYCPKFTKDFKERVRLFFDYKCVECGKPQNGEKLSIHHVNFRKDACCANDITPLFVPLCRNCHTKTSYNRPYWEHHFTEIINQNYGGKCYLTKEEMMINV